MDKRDVAGEGVCAPKTRGWGKPGRPLYSLDAKQQTQYYYERC
jgi:hypothetical protein